MEVVRLFSGIGNGLTVALWSLKCIPLGLVDVFSFQTFIFPVHFFLCYCGCDGVQVCCAIQVFDYQSLDFIDCGYIID
jgi:hypothetical protein